MLAQVWRVPNSWDARWAFRDWEATWARETPERAGSGTGGRGASARSHAGG